MNVLFVKNIFSTNKFIVPLEIFFHIHFWKIIVAEKIHFFFWDCLLLKIVFICSICKLWFSHLSFSLKFEKDSTNDYWNIPLLIFWGHPLEIIFIWSICKLRFVHYSLSVKFEIDPLMQSVVSEIFWYCQTPSSIQNWDFTFPR